MTDDVRDRDRVQARERMRRLRAAGPTLSDRARREALRDLVTLHRDDFDKLFAHHMNRLREEVNAQQTNP